MQWNDSQTTSGNFQDSLLKTKPKEREQWKEKIIQKWKMVFRISALFWIGRMKISI